MVVANTALCSLALTQTLSLIYSLYTVVTYIILDYSYEPILDSHVIDLFAHDPFSSAGYPMITHTHSLASNLPTRALVAWQLQTNTHTHTHTHTHT